MMSTKVDKNCVKLFGIVHMKIFNRIDQKQKITISVN